MALWACTILTCALVSLLLSSLPSPVLTSFAVPGEVISRRFAVEGEELFRMEA